jgi:hypothetical protein
MTRDPRPRTARDRADAALAILATLVLLGLAFPPARAGAASRPYFVTESARTLPHGGMRLELGETRDDWDTGNKYYARTAEFTANLLSSLDLEASIPWVVAGGSVPLNDGPGDIHARVKLRLTAPARPLTVSGLLDVKFPTGVDLVSTQQRDYRVAALATRGLGPVTLDGNLAYTLVGEGAGQNFRNVAGFSVGLDSPTPVARLSGVGELVWEQSRVPGGKASIAFVVGTRYAVTPRVALDANFLVGYGSGPLPGNDHQRGLSGGVGLTWDIGP